MRVPVLILLALLMTTTATFSQSHNHLVLSNKITTETKNITDFSKIEAGEDFEVIIKFSDTKESIEIEANENLHDYIIVEKVGNTLKLNTKSYSTGWYGNKNKNYKSGARERLVAYVTAKQLTSISGEEDVIFELENTLSVDKLEINLEEDCTLSGTINVNTLMVNLDEDSILDIEGGAQKMEVEANEDSMIKGYDFIVQDLAIELSDDSSAKLTVNGDIDLRARGDSNFYYKGKGQIIRQRLTGDSQVKYWK